MAPNHRAGFEAENGLGRAIVPARPVRSHVMPWEELTPSLFQGILMGSLFVLMAVGLTLTYAVSRVINFAHGELVTLGAYAAALAVNLSGLSLLPALVLGAAAGALAALTLDELIYKPLIARRASPLYLLVASIGASIILRHLIYLWPAWCPGRRRRPSSVKSWPARSRGSPSGSRSSVSSLRPTAAQPCVPCSPTRPSMCRMSTWPWPYWWWLRSPGCTSGRRKGSSGGPTAWTASPAPSDSSKERHPGAWPTPAWSWLWQRAHTSWWSGSPTPPSGG